MWSPSSRALFCLLLALLKEKTLVASERSLLSRDSSSVHHKRGIGLQVVPILPSTVPPPNENVIIKDDFEDEGFEQSTGEFRALKKAIQWTKDQMNPDWGWGSDTPNTLLALALANTTFFPSKSLEAQLLMKEFELQLVLKLWRRKEAYMSTGHLALNVMVLLALCKDPRNFHSRDLVGALEHKEARVDFEVAFSALASCSAGRHLRKSRIRKLLDIILDRSKRHSIDTLSVVILALHCAQGQRKQDLTKYIFESVNFLLEQQMEDGSFGSNLHTTAIALQALTSSGLGSSWNATKALQYVMSHQSSDGSFGNLFDTNSVLPLLGSTTFLNISTMQCDNRVLVELPELYEVNSEDSLSNTGIQGYDLYSNKPSLINMTYVIWIGNEAKERYNISLSVAQNTTFLQIMKLAAERDEHFEFAATKWANGYYIHTLAGKKENQVGYWFWLLYRLKEPPIPGTKPDNKNVVAKGVQELIPEDGDFILFWYHTI